MIIIRERKKVSEWVREREGEIEIEKLMKIIKNNT